MMMGKKSSPLSRKGVLKNNQKIRLKKASLRRRLIDGTETMDALIEVVVDVEGTKLEATVTISNPI
jgi:hypothetical protein